MTPFGRRMREMRAKKGVSQKHMAAAIGVSAAYLSALEHGRRGAPSWPFLQKVIGYFNVIWDEAEELLAIAERSHPRVVVDTSGLSPEATELAHRLALSIAHLSRRDIERVTAILDAVDPQTTSAVPDPAGPHPGGLDGPDPVSSLETAPAVQRAGR